MRAAPLALCAALALACAFLSSAACLTERAASAPLVAVRVRFPAPAPPPTNTGDADADAGAVAPAGCAVHHVAIVEGPVPGDAVEVARGVTEAHEDHLSLRAHEEAAAKAGADHCVDGVSVLRATEGPRGVTSAVVVFWRRAPDAGVP